MQDVAEPVGVDWVSEVSECSKMGKGSKLNVLCWPTSFHLLHHTDIVCQPDEGRTLVCVSKGSKMISRLVDCLSDPQQLIYVYT